MKVECVEVYKAKASNKKFLGTAHIYLCDYGIDLRGVGVFKRKKSVFCMLSDRTAIDPETQEKVRYPIFHFTDQAKQKDLMDSICKAVYEYMEANK